MSQKYTECKVIAPNTCEGIFYTLLEKILIKTLFPLLKLQIFLGQQEFLHGYKVRKSSFYETKQYMLYIAKHTFH